MVAASCPPKPLTSPTLLSHLTPTLPGEEGDCFKFAFSKPLLSRWKGVRWERRSWGGEGSEAADRSRSSTNSRRQRPHHPAHLLELVLVDGVAQVRIDPLRHLGAHLTQHLRRPG